MSTAITVAANLPSMPAVLVDEKFIGAIAEIEGTVASLKVADAKSAQTAANLQGRLANAGRMLEKARKELKQPFLDAGRAIDDAARAPVLRIEKAKTALKRSLSDYHDEQLRIQREEERKRQEELARLEAKRHAEEEAEKRRVEELAKAAVKAAPEQAGFDDFDFAPAEPPPKSETEKEIDRLKYTPAPKVEAPQGVTFRTTLRIKSVDVAALPDAFVIRTANESLIRSTFCTGWKDGAPIPNCPGVEFAIDRMPVTRGGREEF